MSLLEQRDLTDEERAASADEPRPGVWIEERDRPADLHGDILVDRRGDGRTLTQEETDILVACELHMTAPLSSSGELHAILGEVAALIMIDEQRLSQHAYQQRGGIHSDPLVRLLAFRVWGERDRRWRKRDTAISLVARLVVAADHIDAWRRAYGFDGVAVYDHHPDRAVVYQASRGGREARAKISHVTMAAYSHARHHELILDVFDELDAKLSAGGDPPTTGPTFEIG